MDKHVLEKWAKADLWRLDEFAVLCCGFDPDNRLSDNRPDDYYIEANEIREQVRRAVITGSLLAVPEPDQSRADSIYGHEQYFRPTDAVKWASHRFEAFPKFSKNISQLNPTSHQKLETPTELEQNQYWSELSKTAKRAIDAYPAWVKREGKPKKKAILIEWLETQQGMKTREAEIIKNVLSEHFDL